MFSPALIRAPCWKEYPCAAHGILEILDTCFLTKQNIQPETSLQMSATNAEGVSLLTLHQYDQSISVYLEYMKCMYDIHRHSRVKVLVTS